MTSKSVWRVADFGKEVVKVQGKAFVSVGPKLAILREHFSDASIVTEIVTAYTDPNAVTIRATITSGARVATALGTSNVVGDKALADSLFELAETRALARALRFFGIGIDAAGAEEVQGRKPIHDREADEPQPLPEGAAPSKEQVAQLRDLRNKLKAANVSVDDIPIPETADAASSLLVEMTKRLNEAPPPRGA